MRVSLDSNTKKKCITGQTDRRATPATNANLAELFFLVMNEPLGTNFLFFNHWSSAFFFFLLFVPLAQHLGYYFFFFMASYDSEKGTTWRECFDGSRKGVCGLLSGSWFFFACAFCGYILDDGSLFCRARLLNKVFLLLLSILCFFILHLSLFFLCSQGMVYYGPRHLLSTMLLYSWASRLKTG